MSARSAGGVPLQIGSERAHLEAAPVHRLLLLLILGCGARWLRDHQAGELCHAAAGRLGARARKL